MGHNFNIYEDEDYLFTTIDEFYDTTNTARSSCLKARYPAIMQKARAKGYAEWPPPRKRKSLSMTNWTGAMPPTVGTNSRHQ